MEGVPSESRDLGKPDVLTPSADCLRWGVDVCVGRIRDETARDFG